MKEKSKSEVSIIGGADGPTSIFIAGRTRKKPLKVRIRNIIYRYRRKIVEKMCREEYAAFDYIICMERYNIQNIMRIIGNDPEHKVQRLLDYTNRPRDIADPWYTGNFDETFDDVMEGCQAFLSYLMEHLQ